MTEGGEMSRLRSKLTYANVIATLALFIAMGGASAVAATQLAKNSVGTKQLKADSVTAAKIKNGAITGDKVNLASLGTVPTATSASSASTAANATQLGGIPAPGYQEKVMWARVSEEGKILAQSGGISVEAHPYAGAYYLHFPGQVAGRGLFTSPAETEGTTHSDVSILSTPCGGGSSDALKCPIGGDTTNDAFVETLINGTTANSDFYIAVMP
jgi:hypothetical protein